MEHEEPRGDRFQASLEEPLIVDGNVIVAKAADVYGQLAESKESGTFTGRSQLRLELTGIVINGQTIPVATGEYESAAPPTVLFAVLAPN